MPEIRASVGRGGVNHHDDVVLVQQLLNVHVASFGLPMLSVDGDAADNTVKAIRRYQRDVVGISQTDGRIDPGGRTWRALAAGQMVQPAGVPDGGPPPLSGEAWWHSNQARFPNSNSISTLVPPFQGRVRAFIDAMQQAGAAISVSATQRNPIRAYLMHFSWQVANGAVRPRDVPAKPGCLIAWDHGNDPRSRAAAREMVRLFDIAFKPSLTSLHIEGRAIDMTIRWNGTLRVADAAGAVHALAAPRNGGENRGLHAVGATYAVRKLRTDPPHWSDNGH